MSKIAICQYQWPLQVQGSNLIRKLKDEGFIIDLFLFQCREGELVDLNHFASDTGITIHNFQTSDKKKLPIFRRASLSLLYRLKIKDDRRTIILKEVLKQSQKVFKRYDAVIGIEKRGLIWAGMLLGKNKISKLVYYSLELYLEDDYFKSRIPEFKKLRRLEKKYHQGCAATIIQDPERAAILFYYNRVDTFPIYLPVSIRGSRITKKSNYFHQKFNLSKNVKIILYFGMLTTNRFCTELMQCSSNLGKDEILILHGYGQADEIERLKFLENGKARLSMEIVPEEKIGEVIASCDIGIALYGNKCYNDRLTAFSSEKIALYAQAGKPFITFDYNSYQSLRNEFCCCELIHSTDELPKAVETIINHYEIYRQNAFSAFDKYYDFDKVNKGLMAYLKPSLN